MLGCSPLVKTGRPYRSVCECYVVYQFQGLILRILQNGTFPEKCAPVWSKSKKLHINCRSNWCIPFAKWLNWLANYVMFKKTSRSVLSRLRLVGLDPIKHVLWVFWTASKTFLEKRVSKEFITIMLLWTLEISIREKHCILMTSVLSANKTLHTNKEEVYRYKVTSRDVLSTIW